MRNIRSWRELKVILKWRFPILNDEDFLMEDHDREGMIAGLTVKLDKTRHEFDLILDELQSY